MDDKEKVLAFVQNKGFSNADVLELVQDLLGLVQDSLDEGLDEDLGDELDDELGAESEVKVEKKDAPVRLKKVSVVGEPEE